MFKRLIFFIGYAVILLYLVLCLWLLIGIKFLNNQLLTICFEFIVIGISLFLNYLVSSIIYYFDYQLQRYKKICKITIFNLLVIVIVTLWAYNLQLSSLLRSLCSLLVSYIMCTIFAVYETWKTELAKVIIEVKSNDNVYRDSKGQVCAVKTAEKDSFSFQIRSEKDYNYEFCGLAEWNNVNKILKKVKKNGSIHSTDETDKHFISNDKKTYSIKISDFLNKYRTFLGINNQFFIVVKYKNKGKKREHYLYESILLLEKQNSKLAKSKDISDYSWEIRELISPFLMSAGLSAWATAIFIVFHRWFEFQLLRVETLQRCLDFRDINQTSLGFNFIIGGFISIYISFFLNYIVKMVRLQNIEDDNEDHKVKNDKIRERLFHNCIIKIIEMTILVIPLLLFKNYEIQYDTNGYIKLSYTLILIFFVSVLWLCFNIIKGVTILFRWILPEYFPKKDAEKNEYPKTNLLINIFSLIVGWMLGKKL